MKTRVSLKYFMTDCSRSLFLYDKDILVNNKDIHLKKSSEESYLNYLFIMAVLLKFRLRRLI